MFQVSAFKQQQFYCCFLHNHYNNVFHWNTHKNIFKMPISSFGLSYISVFLDLEQFDLYDIDPYLEIWKYFANTRVKIVWKTNSCVFYLLFHLTLKVIFCFWCLIFTRIFLLWLTNNTLFYFDMFFSKSILNVWTNWTYRFQMNFIMHLC